MKPELSPTKKDQYKLPGLKIGITGSDRGAPTLEGTPLMEAAICAAKDRMQTKLFEEEE